MDFTGISWLAVLLAAGAFFALGGLWYGLLFSDMWLRAAGLSEDDAQGPSLAVINGAAIVLELLAAVGLAAVIGPDAGVMAGLGVGAAVGGLIVVPLLGVLSLYEQRSPMLWVLNSGYNLLGFLAMGAVIGAL